MQEKTNRLKSFASPAGLRVNSTKTELGDEVLRYVDRFTYLGGVYTNGGGADEDINRRLSKARPAFRMLEPVWRSSQYCCIRKIRLYQSCVVSVLLYGSECWKMMTLMHANSTPSTPKVSKGSRKSSGH